MSSTGKGPVVKSSSKSSLPVPSVISLVEQRVEESCKLQSRVDTVLSDFEKKGKCTREAWGYWITSVIKDIDDHFLTEFYQQTFNTIMTFVKRTWALW